MTNRKQRWNQTLHKVLPLGQMRHKRTPLSRTLGSLKPNIQPNYNFEYLCKDNFVPARERYCILYCFINSQPGRVRRTIKIVAYRWYDTTIRNYSMAEEKYILVVDDEPTLLEFLDIYLSEEGYRVERASNGLEAIKMTEVRDYNAIITDVMMPVMDGIDFYKKLSTVSPHLTERVIFISGYICKDQASFIKKTGRRLLPKPFQMTDINSALDSIRKQKPQTMENAFC